MKKITQFFLAVAFLLAYQSLAYAQSNDCQFIFKGVLAGKAVTMCFMPDESDGNVNGEYYYGKGTNGVMSFSGTAKQQQNGTFKQRLEETNADGVVTGYFTGILAKGVMTGTWTSADGTHSYPYRLTLQK